MHPLIALQTVIDAIEKFHSYAHCTKAEIIRTEQALKTLQALVEQSTNPSKPEDPEITE
jgi:hypothetical protein